MNSPLKIVFSHITRMQFPKICIAGVELQTGIHIRPITGKKDVLDVTFLSQITLGTVADLGWYAPRPAPPEVEDVFFKPNQLKVEKQLSADAFWQSLAGVAETSLTAIFGNSLTLHGTTFFVLPNTGEASLGEWYTQTVKLSYNAQTQKIRLRGALGNAREFSLPVTDIRLYSVKDNEFVPNIQRIQWLSEQLNNTNVILSVGLTRAWSADENLSPRHWLQINGIHPENNPLWQGAP